MILAAGEGRRYGGPKATALLAGEPFLSHVVRACRSGGCESVWAVVRPELPEHAVLARSLGAVPVVNPDPDRGMFSSVQIGLEVGSVEGAEEGWVIFPVDHPRVRGETVGALLSAYPHRPPRSWVQPSFRDQPGHPIVIDADCARRLPGLSPTMTLRDALRSMGLTGHRIPVEDSGVLADMDTPPGSE